MRSRSVEAAAAVGAPKKLAAEKKVPSHPPTSEMVTEAITVLNDRKGTSLQAIKTYMDITYNVDMNRQAIFIRKYIKAAVERKELLQTTGSGANGRFKLADKKKTSTELKKKAKQPKEKKEKAEKKEKVEKKDKAEKKKKETAEKVEKVKPTKEKKTGKALATKTKPPKPKKTLTAAKAK